MTAKTVDNIMGGLAALTDKLMSLCAVPFSVQRWSFSFGCLMSDESAIKAQLAVVGASGYKCCVCCANVYGGDLPEQHETFRHINCCRCEDFDLYTADRFEVCDAVAEKWARPGPAGTEVRPQPAAARRAAQELETLLGAHWNQGRSILHNRAIRANFRFPEAVF